MRVVRGVYVLVGLVVVLMLSGCGTIMHGTVDSADQGETNWAALVLNLFFCPLIGHCVDLIGGGFWTPKPGKDG